MEPQGLGSIARPRPRLLPAVSVAAATLLMSLGPALASARSLHPRLTGAADARRAARQAPSRDSLGPGFRDLIRRGYLVRREARRDRPPAHITGRSPVPRTFQSLVNRPLAPSILTGRSWRGINDTSAAPPDETSAVGTSRYVETVNVRFGIYGKTSNVPLATGTLSSLWGTGQAFATDPQVIWDPTTNRFYFAGAIIISPNDNRLTFGFSKTASPSGASDWCHYTINFGGTFPDFPKLGDSQTFAMIGTNLFDLSTERFLGADIYALSKPTASDTCASYGSAAKTGDKVLSPNTFTPVPANEIDTSPTGWAVATTFSTPSTQLRVFKVTRNANGTPNIGTTPANVGVASYTAPPSAPQRGSANRISTSDARNTQAVAAVDPAQGNRLAIWTQHTVQGGAGAEVRWYEIDPATHSLLQHGKVTSGSLYEFNAAISPNRQVNAGIKTGGNAMVMNYNTSSSTTFPSIKMVSKIGGGAQSAPVSVLNGTKPLGGGDCDANHFCRWGDYAAATPDPSVANQIWQVSQFAVGPAALSDTATSRTWNFVAKP